MEKSFKDFFIDELISLGMFPEQAKKVMYLTVSKDSTMGNRWFDSEKNYPDVIKKILRIQVFEEALDFIKKECPEAWFRPIFDKDHPLRKEFDLLNSKSMTL